MKNLNYSEEAADEIDRMLFLNRKEKGPFGLTTYESNGKRTDFITQFAYSGKQNEDAFILLNFNEDAKDEFEIIYIYPAEAYVGNEADTGLNYGVSVEMKFVTENGTIESIVEQTIELTEKDNKEDITSFKVTDLKQNIYKRFMYSN